ncbi:MAG: ABC transporter permease [Flavihumibacter sp.]
MFRNYFKTARRNLIKNKTFSLLNIAGLSVGITCSLLILLWVNYYLSFNHSITALNHLYNVKNNQTYGADQFTFSATPFKAKEALLESFPAVKKATRFSDLSADVSVPGKIINQHGAYVDPDFFSMFDVTVVKGAPVSDANDVSAVAVSEKLAGMYFGTDDPLNKTITINKHDYRITAVYRDLAQNTQFSGTGFMLPFRIFYDQNIKSDNWGTNITDTWVQLQEGADLAAINHQLGQLIKKNNSKSGNELFLYPLKRMTLYNRFLNGKEDTSRGQYKYVKMFTLIAGIILLIACINFMNLSTARSEKRAKEIGLRKVLGAAKSELVARFLSESMILSFVAVVLSVLTVLLVLPSFNTLVGLPLSLNPGGGWLWAALLLIALICGLTAGSYPALYLSSFNPIRALKKQVTKTAGGSGWVRKGLVITQFVVSSVMIIAVLLIYQQIQYGRNRDLGFNKNNLLYIATTPEMIKGYPSLTQSLMQTGQVSAVSLGSHTPFNMWANGGGLHWEGKEENGDVLVTYLGGDADYLRTFDIHLLEGRGFSPDPKADSGGVIINEAFARLMGKEGHAGGRLWSGNDKEDAAVIIGITKNFVYNDITEKEPAPLLLYNSSQAANLVFVRLKPGADLQKALAAVKTAFVNADASTAFDYHFLDADFEKNFSTIRFTGSLATLFGSLAVFISCLGLFGLSAFTAEQRIKEIGIRKVLGASSGSIVSLLSKDFMLLTGISCVIAFPIGYWIMSNWLQNYDYRITISWQVFALTAVIVLLIALVTVSTQSLRAAATNPIKSIRTE